MESIDSPEFRALEADFVRETIAFAPQDHHADNAALFAARSAMIAHIDAKLTAARRDAERYQWLRARHVDAGFVEVPEIKCWPDGTKAYRRIGGYGAELDKQIDAAMLAAAPATEKEGE